MTYIPYIAATVNWDLLHALYICLSHLYKNRNPRAFIVLLIKGCYKRIIGSDECSPNAYCL